jgi:hypothetical protein
MPRDEDDREFPVRRGLAANDAYLRDLNIWYRDHSGDAGIATLAFFETRPTKGVMVVEAFAEKDISIILTCLNGATGRSIWRDGPTATACTAEKAARFFAAL